MAGANDISEVRRNADLASDDEVWTDTVLGALIDSLGVVGTTAKVWDAKAASYVDESTQTTEGGSTHRYESHKNAVEMAKLWAGRFSEETAPVATGPVVNDIVRET